MRVLPVLLSLLVAVLAGVACVAWWGEASESPPEPPGTGGRHESPAPVVESHREAVPAPPPRDREEDEGVVRDDWSHVLRGRLVGLVATHPWSTPLRIQLVENWILKEGIHVSRDPGRFLDRSYTGPLRSVTVGPAGVFEVDLRADLEAAARSHRGSLWVLIRLSDPFYAQQSFVLRVERWLPPVEPEYRVQPVRSLAGTVHSAVGPGVGAQVAAFKVEGGQPAVDAAVETTCGEGGVYRLGLLDPGEYLIVAFDPLQAHRPTYELYHADDRAGQKGPDMWMGGGKSIAGRVTLPDQAEPGVRRPLRRDGRRVWPDPVVRALAVDPVGRTLFTEAGSLFWDGGSAEYLVSEARRGAEGQYVLRGLREGLYEVSVSQLRMDPALDRAVRMRVTAPAEGVDFAIDGAILRIEVRLPWTGRESFGGGVVRLKRDGKAILRMPCELNSWGSVQSLAVLVEPGASYAIEASIPGLLPGYETIQISTSNRFQQCYVECSEPDPGEMLAPLGSYHESLRLSVRTYDDRPVERIQLQLLGAIHALRDTVMESATGDHVVPNLTPGDYRVKVIPRTDEPLLPAECEFVVDGNGEVKRSVKLNQAATLRLVARDRSGGRVAATCSLYEAAADWSVVELATEAGPVQRFEVPARGVFDVPGWLRPGRYQIAARIEGELTSRNVYLDRGENSVGVGLPRSP